MELKRINDYSSNHKEGAIEGPKETRRETIEEKELERTVGKSN